ncbi:MAG: sugar phosphate isomerase/epimerase [Clostridiales bacterium]|nr:sugar phosphate isomerase/epimerase [Clostridiales bacterium]
MIIGAQLYTVREFCKTPEDLAQTLKKIADIGYRTVQVSGTCAYEPAWLQEQLSANGLSCVITHTDPARIAAEPEVICREHCVFHCDYIGIGYYELHAEGAVDRFVNNFTKAMQVIHAQGKKLMYHNHDLEFAKIDGRTALEWLAMRTSPEQLGFTLDTYWVQAGGGDPAYWLRSLKGRVSCVHYKDMGYGRKMLPIGSGNMNFDEILKASEEAGVKYALVEQDDCNGEDPFACLAESFAFLTSRGLRAE